jgi:hypothetical protein
MRCAEVKRGGLVGYGVLRTCRVMKQSGIGAACVRLTGFSAWRGIRVPTDF